MSLALLLPDIQTIIDFPVVLGRLTLVALMLDLLLDADWRQTVQDGLLDVSLALLPHLAHHIHEGNGRKETVMRPCPVQQAGVRRVQVAVPEIGKLSF